MKRQRHNNVAIFIPNNGCKNQCSFCDQRSITGQIKQPEVGQIAETLENAKKTLKSRGQMAEIAYFGGSFTAIERKYMLSLLEIANSYLDSETFTGIRVSTRPDAIDEEILEKLKQNGVSAIELGCQSMDDEVLKLNRRGHTAEDVVVATEMIKKWGFSLGHQMMTGLYGSSQEKDLFTAKRILALKPNTVRIYPTVVMKGTMLSELFLKGEYCPLDLEQSIMLCAELLQLFEKAGIPVIRLGLHDTDELKRDMIAGAFHPAFRELCESQIYFNKAMQEIKNRFNFPGNKTIYIYINAEQTSKMIGQRRANVKKFGGLGIRVKVIGSEKIGVNELIISDRREDR